MSQNYVANFIADLVLLFLANKLGDWHLPFLLSDKWLILLPVTNLVLVISLAGNLLLIFYDKLWFQSLVRLLINLAVIYFLYWLLKIFPFNFPIILGTVQPFLFIKVVLALAMIGVIAGTIIAFFRLIKNLFLGAN